MTEPVSVGAALIDFWADDLQGPTGLHLRQELAPIEGKGAVIFPPTYADIGYNVDELSDGTKLCTIDSIGSQANRMEPIFRKAKPGQQENPLARLVPQIEIDIGNERTVSLLDAGHRLGDAIVRSTALKKETEEAFEAYRVRGDASPIAKLAPTTLVFGAWDSRGKNAKLPRIVSATIRAWDISEIHRAAQYEPATDYVAAGLLEASEDKSELDRRSSRGFRHAPAIWRDEGRKQRVLGGVIARGSIAREVTVNLVALRQLGGENGDKLRRYILSLVLLAAKDPQDGFLRQGCLLTLDPDTPEQWACVARTGIRTSIDIASDVLRNYAESAAKAFGVGADRRVKFDAALAKSDLSDGEATKVRKGKGKSGAEEAATG